jgi:UDP-N-acetylglucosamine/UDP-N-acetylgalactosamine diphosphorylase
LVGGKAAVLEYSELDKSEKEATDTTGNLKFGIANLGLYCFSLDFIGRASAQQLPLHSAMKAVKMLGADGKSTIPMKPNGRKFEEFIFDIFPFAETVGTLLYPREHCFAPLKNLQGEDSIGTVHAALLAFDREVFAKITGNKPPQDVVFELSPQFYYPTEKMIDKWRGKHLPNQGYIHE